MIDARNLLVDHQLVAYRKPIYQVLALDSGREPVRDDFRNSIDRADPAAADRRNRAMIDYEQFCRIKAYKEEGLKAGQIADKART